MRHLSRNTYSEAQIISARFAAIPETQGQAPFSFTISVLGSFIYVHYTTHGTCSFTSHSKDEAIMVRTHILTTPELESNALDRSAPTITKLRNQ